MVAAEFGFLDLQASQKERLGLGVLAHHSVQLRQVVQARSNLGMVLAKFGFGDLQASQMERLGLGILAHGLIQRP